MLTDLLQLLAFTMITQFNIDLRETQLELLTYLQKSRCIPKAQYKLGLQVSISCFPSFNAEN